MNAERPGSGPDNGANGSWASETLPLSVRRELLERELSKLGFRKPGAGTGAPAGGSAQQQQQPQPQGESTHPQGDPQTPAQGD